MTQLVKQKLFSGVNVISQHLQVISICYGVIFYN